MLFLLGDETIYFSREREGGSFFVCYERERERYGGFDSVAEVMEVEVEAEEEVEEEEVDGSLSLSISLFRKNFHFFLFLFSLSFLSCFPPRHKHTPNSQ